MAEGVIYAMTCVVPGLVKIGKTRTDNFEVRMSHLEHNGYRNITALKREFAIEVDQYDEKEKLLHTIFEKSRVGDTELFAVDIDIVKKLLSSFDGKLIYPEDETKTEVFEEVVGRLSSKLIPDGDYYLTKKKKSDKRAINIKAKVTDGKWKLLKGSIIGVSEGSGVAKNIKITRASLSMNSNGELLEDFELGECSPSFAAGVVVNSSMNGWTAWKTADGNPVDIYRQMAEKKDNDEDE